MEYVVSNRQFIQLLETGYFQSRFGSSELFQYILGAAMYANGQIQQAYQIFESIIKKYPSPFGYLCLSRCAIHISEGDELALKVLKEGLCIYPGDFSLIMSMAGASFRLKKTEAANGFLDSVRETLNRRGADTFAGDQKIELLDAELDRAIRGKLLERPRASFHSVGDRYDESGVKGYWEQLFYAFNTLGRFQHGWANLCYVAQDIITDCITNVDGNIKSIINFGVFCAESDYRLATKFPQIKFIGVDRELSTKTLNDHAFQASNLSFVQANIMDFLSHLPNLNDTKLLFHSRTATLLYPELVLQLYQACAKAGIQYIALYENFSLSRSTLRLYDFDGIPQDSVPYGSVMFIHNYKKLLEKAGYVMLRDTRLPYIDLLWKKNPESLADSHVSVIAKLA